MIERMKKLNKFLCLILMLVMSATSVFAEEEGNTYADSVDFLMAIDVFDNHTAADAVNEITRIEFATVIAGIVFPSENYVWSEEKLYTDVMAEYKAIVSALAEQKIMLGYDPYTFKPDQAITLNEALKTLVSLTGYDYQAIAGGGYPHGYINTASSVGILKNFPNRADRSLTLGEAAKLIENALSVDIMTMSIGSNGVNYSSTEDENLLKRNLDIYEGEGLFKANEYTNIYGGSNAPLNAVIIGEDTYDIKNTNLDAYLGHYVEFYYRAEGENAADRELVYVADDKKVSTLTITSAEITDFESGRYTYCYVNESKGRKADIADGALILYNYRLAEEKSGDELYLPEVGKVELIDNDGDEKYDVVFIWDYETYVVNDVSADTYMIGDYYGQEALDLDPDDVDSRIIKDDVIVDLTAVEKWNVLSVAKSEGENPYITVIVSNKRVTGDVNKFDSEYITIDGKEYKRSPVFNQKINHGQTFDYYLDFLGYVAVYDKNSGSDYVTNGILVRYKLVDEFLDTPPELLIFTEDGVMNWYPAAEKLTFDGIRGVKAADMFDRTKPNVIINNEGIIPQMIGFKLNKNGEVSFIDTVDKGSNEDEDSLNQTKFYPSRSGYQYMLLGHTWSDEIAMANGLTIFKVPADNQGNIYKGMEYDKYYATQQWGAWWNPFYDHYDTYPVRFFNVNEAQVSDLMIWYTPVDGSDAKFGPMIVVKSIGEAINEDEMTVLELTGWIKGAEVKKYIFEEGKENLADGIKAGDIVQVAENNDGEIMALSKFLSPSTDDYMISSTVPYATIRILYGEITAIDRDHGVVVVSYQKNPDGSWVTPGIVNVLVGESGNDGAVMKYNPMTNKMEKGNHSELKLGQKVIFEKNETAVRSIVLFEER